MVLLTKERHGVFRFVTVGVLTFFVWTFLLVHPAATQEKVQVPGGTAVILSTNAAIAPGELNVGDPVDLSVVSDVVVNGKAVIKAGAKARGEVTACKKRNYIGIAAEIGVAARSVEAVDGTMISLAGTKSIKGEDKMVFTIALSLLCCILFALMKGGDASIPAGSQINATVTGTTSITVR